MDAHPFQPMRANVNVPSSTDYTTDYTTRLFKPQSLGKPITKTG